MLRIACADTGRLLSQRLQSQAKRVGPLASASHPHGSQDVLVIEPRFLESSPVTRQSFYSQRVNRHGDFNDETSNDKIGHTVPTSASSDQLRRRMSSAYVAPQAQDRSTTHLKNVADLLPKHIDTTRPRVFRPKILNRAIRNSGREDQPGTGHPFEDYRTSLELLKSATRPSVTADDCSDAKIFRTVDSSRRAGVNTLPGKPATWTESSFAGYTHAVIAFEPAEKTLQDVIHNMSSRSGSVTQDNQKELLKEIFYEPYLRNCVSVKAGNEFLGFLYDHEQYHEARALFLHMERLFGEVPMSTWNIVLRASAKSNKLRAFTSQLLVLTKRHMSPDIETWISFLMLLPSVNIKNQVLAIMRERGLLNAPQARRKVANRMCLEDFNTYKELGPGSQPFFDFMDQRYDCDWASTATVNILLGEILLRPRSGATLAALYQGLVILHQMKQRAFVADKTTMDIFLHSLLKIGREDVIIEVLEIFERQWGLAPDRQAHWRLFVYGWRRRKYNFLRVIWVSACLKGYTTSWERYSVVQSMLSYSMVPSQDAGEIFRRTIGWFLTGFHTSESLANMIPPGESNVPHEQCHLILKSNIATFGQGAIQEPLTSGLRKALASDAKWDFYRALSKPLQNINRDGQVEIAIVKTKYDERLNKRSINELSHRLRQHRSRTKGQSPFQIRRHASRTKARSNDWRVDRTSGGSHGRPA